MASMKRRKRRQTPKQNLQADGALCVTFVNTAWRQQLETYDDLVAWGVEVGTLSSSDAPRLGQAAAERPGVAAGVVRRAKTLRARLERILLALVKGEKAAAADFNAFNSELRTVLSKHNLVQTTNGYRWAWAVEHGEEDLARMLWPVIHSAAHLLTSAARSRVSRCPGQDCDLFFIARDSGSPQKWCSSTCGARSRSVKHYHRRVKPQRKELQRRFRQNASVRMELETFSDESGDEKPDS